MDPKIEFLDYQVSQSKSKQIPDFSPANPSLI